VVSLRQNSDLAIRGKKLGYLRDGDVPGALVQGTSEDILELSAISGYFLHSQGTKPAHKIQAHTLKRCAVRQENKKPRVQMVCGYVDISSVCKEIRSYVPLVSVPATGLSLQQTTITRKKML